MGKSKSRTAKPAATASRADQPVKKAGKVIKESWKSLGRRKPKAPESETQPKSVQPKEKADRVAGIRIRPRGEESRDHRCDEDQFGHATAQEFPPRQP